MIRPTLLFICLTLCAAGAHAERADRDKPVNIEADRATADDAKQVHVFEGNVVLTQGTLVIKTDKLVVAQDNAGYQHGTATGGPNGLAYFKQKREGRDEYMEGVADRIEHNARSEKSEFFGHAWIKSGQDEVKGQYIIYDAKTDRYTVTNGPNGTVLPSGSQSQERVRAVIHPKNQTP
ncbi:MAG: lipopolysaccharide transport periplasmic protein LptA [Proteobacteria bacterium]|nr:lipopolysaccharide transport periplasmic protein LptA [Pseudomonadota bacterium]HQR03751.1 lipopolysaccharide transport periplasmic protein LptA [Rhodocyclaceae bacterium]